MASWTDAIPQFNPYISQLPVEAMVSVGMQKQQMYEEGLQKIQSEIDRVAGLDIVRDVDRQYLQSKLDELGSNLKTVAAGDFSNFQLVNSVSGMAKQISKDKFISAAVQSTANDRKQKAYMEEARKKGTLNPSNEYNYLKRRNKYYQSGLSDSEGNPIVFNDSYKDYFDFNKFAKETFDAVKPDGYTIDQVYVTDADGNIKIVNGQPVYSPTMTRLIKEGRMPEKVKETINQIFSDPRVGQQLSIDGEYVYRGYDGEALVEKINLQRDELLETYDEKMADLLIKKSMGKDVESQIDELQSVIDNVKSNYDSYLQIALSNPDAARSQLYKDDVRSRFATMFGHITTKQEVHSNPGWEANFKLQKEANELEKWKIQRAFEREKFEDEKKRWWAKFEQDDRLGGKGSLSGQTPTLGDMPSGVSLESRFDDDYNNLSSKFINSSDQLIWETVLSKSPLNVKRAQELVKSGAASDMNSAISMIVESTAKAGGQDISAYRTQTVQNIVREYNNLSPVEKSKNPSLGKLIENYDNANLGFTAISSIKKQLDIDQKVGTGVIDKSDVLKELKGLNISYSGKNYNLSKDDVYDLSNAAYLIEKAYYSNDKVLANKAEAAMNILKSKGLEGLLDLHIPRQVGGAKVGPTFVGGTHSNKQLSEQFKKLYDIFESSSFKRGAERRQELIKQYYGTSPVLEIPMLTGDVEKDRATQTTLRNLSGVYSEGQTQNMSSDFRDFAKEISGDLTDVTFHARSVMLPGRVPSVEIVLYDKNSKRVGGMTIQRDEALRLGIDVDKLYVSPETSALQSYIKYNGGYSTRGGMDPKNVETYLDNNYVLTKESFPKMKNSNYTVKGNIKLVNGEYIPYIYVSNGKNQVVREFPGDANLNVVLSTLKETLTPSLADVILQGN